ncbi:MAG: hypothetical protein V4484_22655 [Pseudomonadota bacterium]
MNGRRALSATLIDVVDGLGLGPGPGLRTTSIELTLPVEISIEQQDGEQVLLADLPRFIYRTAFDLAPSRLTVLWEEGEVT